MLPDRLIVFVVTRDSVRSISTEIDAEELVARVRLARELVGRRDVTAVQSVPVLEALHQRLMQPVLPLLGSGVRRLLVVPHGTLAYLPFGALRDAATSKYLVERYSLIVLPTASALPALRAPRRPDVQGGTRRSYALAPLDDALPASRVEAQRFRRTVRGSDALIGARATEAVLRFALGQGGMVHVATHGVMNARNPMFSRIELAPGPGSGPVDDGRLEVHEVLGLTIRSPLVFLSGCETGLGAAWSTSFDRGEDYATLAQAFLYAGARNVVATLWRVADESAAEFAARFYDSLPTLGAAEALAAAQRTMIRDQQYQAPYFWASYQVSGDGSSGSAARN
jgi:CHAT domain-containing protein